MFIVRILWIFFLGFWTLEVCFVHLPRFVESFGKIVNFLQCLFNVFLLGIFFGVVVEFDCFLFSIFVRCYKELGDISSCTWGLEESTLVVGGLYGWGENLWPRIPRCPSPFCMISPLGCLI